MRSNRHHQAPPAAVVTIYRFFIPSFYFSQVCFFPCPYYTIFKCFNFPENCYNAPHLSIYCSSPINPSRIPRTPLPLRFLSHVSLCAFYYLSLQTFLNVRFPSFLPHITKHTFLLPFPPRSIFFFYLKRFPCIRRIRPSYICILSFHNSAKLSRLRESPSMKAAM